MSAIGALVKLQWCRRGRIEVGDRSAVVRRSSGCGGVRLRLRELLLELGEESLVFLAQQLGLLPQPLILLHYVVVLQIQLCVKPLHSCVFTMLTSLNLGKVIILKYVLPQLQPIEFKSKNKMKEYNVYVYNVGIINPNVVSEQVHLFSRKKESTGHSCNLIRDMQ